MATNGYGNPMIVLLALLASLNVRTALGGDANAAALKEFGTCVRRTNLAMDVLPDALP